MIQKLFSETIIRRDNLQKYHLIIVGGIKAAQLAKAFRQYNQYYDVLLVNQHSKQQISQIFNTITIDPKSILDGSDISFTDGIGVKQINKDHIQLINGKQIQFDRLVITQEYEDLFNIQGLEEALKDRYHPEQVYSRTQNYESKNFTDIFKFKEGQFYFYIPKRPFENEDNISYLRLIELLPKEVNLHVISPNESLLSEEQIKQITARHQNIHFHLNKDITNLDKQNRQLTVDNQQLHYDCVYFHGLPQQKLYQEYNNYFVSDSLFEEAKNIIYELQGQKPQVIKQNNSINQLYIGNYRVQTLFSEPESKFDQVYQKLANSLPLQLWRYIWLTQLNYKLYSTNQLLQSFIKGWKTSKVAPKYVQRKLEVQEIIKPQTLPLIYKFSKQQINQSLVQGILSQYQFQDKSKKPNLADSQNTTKIESLQNQKVQEVKNIESNDSKLNIHAPVVNQVSQQEIQNQVSQKEESVTIKQEINSTPSSETTPQAQQESQPIKKTRKRKSK
ncbi:hypothetical protein pb186bvf_001647 [Paramecium bursaria]